jgi:transcriptional regulator with XRE-family HTH domain
MVMGRQRRPVPKLLAKKLKRLRAERGWTQMQMAEKLGRVPSAPDGAMISRFERGEREPSLLVLHAYAKVVGVPVDLFIDDRFSVENFAKAIT